MEENKEVVEVEATEVKETEVVEETTDNGVSVVKSLDKIDEKRKKFWDIYSQQKKANNWVIIPAMIASILIFIILSNYYFIALLLVGAILVGLFIYTNAVKKKVDALLQAYVKDYYTLFNGYTLYSKNITEMTYDQEEKLEKKEFADAGFILDIHSTNSRNVVHGKWFGLKFKAADLVAKILVSKKEEVCFLGKFFEIDASEETEYKTVIYIKPHEDNGSGPNNIGGLDERKDLGLGEKIVVWSSDPQVKKIFTKKVITALQAFDPNKDLVDVAISILRDKIYIALSYENGLLVLPSQEPLVRGPVEQYKSDVAKVDALLKALTDQK